MQPESTSLGIWFWPADSLVVRMQVDAVSRAASKISGYPLLGARERSSINAAREKERYETKYLEQMGSLY